jgi:uncharacterized protein YecT (DUF1311 family)
VIAVVASVLLAQVGASEAVSECDDPRTPQEMYQCSLKDFEGVEAELEEQWKRTFDALQDRNTGDESSSDPRPQPDDTALASQRAWLEYRDAECATEAALAGRPSGRSVEVTLELQCKTYLTQLRLGELRNLAADAQDQ